MGIFDIFKKKEESAVQPSQTPMEVVNVEPIMQTPTSAVQPAPQVAVEQPVIQQPVVEQPVAQMNAMSAPQAPVQEVTPSQTSVQEISEPVVPLGQLPDNPFMEPVQPVQTEAAVTNEAATPSFDDIFNVQPTAEPVVQNSEAPVGVSEQVAEPSVVEPESPEIDIPNAVDTGAVVDEPKPIVEQQIALNVNPDEVFEGGLTKEDAITKIVAEQTMNNENDSQIDNSQEVNNINPNTTNEIEDNNVVPVVDNNLAETVVIPVVTDTSAPAVVENAEPTAPEMSDVVANEVPAVEPSLETTPINNEPVVNTEVVQTSEQNDEKTVPVNEEVAVPVVEEQPVSVEVQPAAVDTQPVEAQPIQEQVEVATEPVVESRTEEPIQPTIAPSTTVEPVVSTSEITEEVQPVEVVNNEENIVQEAVEPVKVLENADAPQPTEEVAPQVVTIEESPVQPTLSTPTASEEVIPEEANVITPVVVEDSTDLVPNNEEGPAQGTIQAENVEQGQEVIQPVTLENNNASVEPEVTKEEEVAQVEVVPASEEAATQELVDPQPAEQQLVVEQAVAQTSEMNAPQTLVVEEPTPVVVEEPQVVVEPTPVETVVESVNEVVPEQTEEFSETVPVVVEEVAQPVENPTPVTEETNIPLAATIPPINPDTIQPSKIIFCDNCGSIISDETMGICPNCGEPIK